MAKIKTINAISEEGLSLFRERGYEVSPDEESPDAIILRSSSLHEMQFKDNMVAIGRAGAGYNNIPIERCSEEGIVVFNAPGANAEAVKEQVMMALVMSSRNVLGAIDFVRSIKDRGEEIPKLVEKGKSSFAGPEIMGKTLGVIGLGATGALVANMGVDFGMKVYGYDPFMSIDAAWILSKEIIHIENLDELFANCDYISVNVPFTPQTENMFNAEAFKKMKKGVRIVNESRAEVINDDDMTEALKEGIVGKYITDFPNEKILKAPNVIAMPHLGACTPESEERCAYMAAQQLIDYIENGNIKNSVNFPSANLSRMGKCRLCVIHRNVPKMLTKILDFISERNINVEHMLNKSRGDYAYTVVDLDKKIGPKTAEEIKKIENVLRVRVLYVD